MKAKLLALACCAAMVGCGSTAQQPALTPQQSSALFAEQSLKTEDIGGTSIQIPSTWQFKSYPMPKVGDIKAVNYRIRFADMKIAITGFNAEQDKMNTEEALRDALAMGASRYLRKAVETNADYQSISNARAKGVYASFSCPSSNPCFNGLIGSPSSLITIANVRAKDMVYTVTVTVNDETNRALAIEVLKTIGKE